MPVVKRIVCLANSRKRSGRCVAGVELSGRRRVGWIRPVSAREHEEVSEYERQFEDGSDPRVLDLIDVPLLEPRPKIYQQENWLLDPDQYWRKAGRFVWEDLHGLAERVLLAEEIGGHLVADEHDPPLLGQVALVEKAAARGRDQVAHGPEGGVHAAHAGVRA